ncbi:rRNA maturation RNase YbeY [Pareuzebyella sediminis]|uniref:rRNA maturation RNase YbeY n=1 Tax=Pareuzebyella sediminis TaxID=2607998 RepID=UPI0011EEDE17|nr:rRNA maturation RNase YbeY [Pareuzebyella sediminis]
MIEFFYETDFKLSNEPQYSDWIGRVVISEEASLGALNYIFCDDVYLLDINKKFLSHDTYTDIISFDYSENELIAGDVFISVQRVKANSIKFKTGFHQELLRVMSHGVLHFLGYNDKSEKECMAMREKENEKIKMFHVEH